MRNISLRKKVSIDHEHYRTLVHNAVKECITADALHEKDPVTALVKVAAAQSSIITAANLVGGMDTLTHLSGGLNIANISNTMIFHERQMRAVLFQRGMCPKHILSEFTYEHVNEQEIVAPKTPLTPTNLLPPLKID